jgi:hypothetical protein
MGIGRKRTYCTVTIALVVVADRLVTKVDAEFATHDFVVVQVANC